MPLEPEAFRDTLQDILTFFDDKRVLRVCEVSRYTGLNRKTVAKRYSFKAGYISAVVLAKEMS